MEYARTTLAPATAPVRVSGNALPIAQYGIDRVEREFDKCEQVRKKWAK
jgi:hypothetical protein